MDSTSSLSSFRWTPLAGLRSRALPTRPPCALPKATAKLAKSGFPVVRRERVLQVQASGVDIGGGESTVEGSAGERKPLVLIAGGGIGGLVAAIGLLKAGYEVKVFERDTTAIRGEGAYRGPIQVQSNALAALEVIDDEVAEQVFSNGVITGDRINGLCDGLTGDWYVKFDTFHPAVEKGLPVTRVINRVALQNILSAAVKRLGGDEIVQGNSYVVDYSEEVDSSTGKGKVWAILQDGRKYEGDMLLGADGIWSKTREALWGQQDPSYSEYTCYSGISDFTPADIDTVGYRVFLGNGQYFVTSDVGGGKMQWYGFHREPAGGADPEGKQKERLMEIFGHWCDGVVDLIQATPENDILRRDIYDRPPIFQWSKNRVVLIGDSAHAMQPNMGQGGCMAIEDGHQLAITLEKAFKDGKGDASRIDFTGALNEYSNSRVLRVGAVHGMSGMAAISASTYKAYLGEGLGPLSFIQKFKIPHPGRVGGQFILKYAMPAVLEWILGGNIGALKESESFRPSCKLSDVPKHFSMDLFDNFMDDDIALIRASRADWMLVPKDCLDFNEGVEVTEDKAVTIGSKSSSCDIVIDDAKVQTEHARVSKSETDYIIEGLSTESMTYINGEPLLSGRKLVLKPGDVLEFGSSPSSQAYKVKLRHVSQRTESAQAAAREMATAA